MPDGVVQWVDPHSGEARVVHLGRRYPAEVEAMEPAARHAGARVHFDVARRAGVPTAVNVALVPGTRSSRRQRRFGDLTGARSPDSKGAAPFATPQPGIGHDLQQHPMVVARRWAELIAAGDLDKAMLLYAPAAALHTAGGVVVGLARIRDRLAGEPVVGSGLAATVHGEDSAIVVTWGERADATGAVESHLRVAHGEIAEQWLGSCWETTAAEPALPMVVHTSGDVEPAERAYALDKVAKLAHIVEEPVLFALVRLARASDPARQRPATVRVVLDINGEPLRVHASARTMAEAVDLLEQRLRDRLHHLDMARRALRRRGPQSRPGEWRHGDPPTARPPYFPRPAEERELVRRKTYVPEDMTVDEATFDLEAMDWDFYLFRDLATGQDSLLHRQGNDYRLAYLDGPPGGGLDDAAPAQAAAQAAARASVTVAAQPAPELDLAGALERLDVGDEPWVFYRDGTTGRGHVVYRRYDGHYGLITPVDGSASLTWYPET